MSNLEPVKAKKSRNFSAIWLLPIIALAITLWIGWQSYQSRGVTITIAFNNGSGIQANKTNVMYKGIAIGKVNDLNIDTKTKGVIATVEIDKDAIPYIGKNSQFWLVSPKVSLAGITGLETIVSGVYISVNPIEGEFSTKFVALQEAPSLLDNVPGLHLTLKAEQLGSIDKGSPIYYKQLQVGEVNNYQLAEDKRSVNVNILIYEPYRQLVNRNTRFWNASGVTVTGGLAGFKVHTDSLVSLITGGIAFDTAQGLDENKEPLDPQLPFKLYADYTEAQAGIKVDLRLNELAGLTEGKTAVMNQGVQVGILRKIKIDKDFKGATAVLSLDPRTESLLTEGTQFWIVKPTISLTGISGLETLIRGNYIEVRLSDQGKPTREFTIRHKAPPLNIDAPGLHLILKSNQLGSIDVGSPILYKQLKVGSVQSYQLSKNKQQVIIGIHIDPEYASLVNESTRFWNASGIMLKGGLSGVEVKTESLMTVLAGGIVFSTPDLKAKPIKRIKAFPLYPSEQDANTQGTVITLKLDNTQGLTEGTPIRVRGLEVGIIEKVSFDKNLSGIIAQARITQGENLITRSNTLFWVVKPELGLLKTANLGTLITGTYLEASPGTEKAARKTTFTVQSDLPPAEAQKEAGLHIMLTAARKGSLNIGTPITYREIVVGKVTNFSLSPKADRVFIDVLIEPKYAPLVRNNSEFWLTSGVSVNAGLFKGVQIRTESIESIMAGGIAFATPNNPGVQATKGKFFVLYKEPKEEWFNWAPQIPLKN